MGVARGEVFLGTLLPHVDVLDTDSIPDGRVLSDSTAAGPHAPLGLCHLKTC